MNAKDTSLIAAKTSMDTVPQAVLPYDTSRIAILPPGKSNTWLFKDATEMDLSDEDLANTEKILVECLQRHNSKEDKTKHFTEYIDIKKYKRQYIPFTDATGDRKVYVNCFCIAGWGFDDWKKMLVQVDDGGACFFQVTINLTKGGYEQFSTNGYG